MIYHEISMNINNENIAFEFINFLTDGIGFTETYSDMCVVKLCIEYSKFAELHEDEEMFRIYNNIKMKYISNTSSALVIYSKGE